MPAIDWLPWSVDTFARARAERKPVLLSLSAGWCGACLEMDRTSYADPDVASLVAEAFVAIRVDADRRPDIADRYSLGGLPTTAFLTVEGDLVGGGTYVSNVRMGRALQRVVEAFAVRGEEIARRATEVRDAAPTERRSDPKPADLLAVVFDTFDVECGGFGTEPKFPLPAALELAIEESRRSGDAAMNRIVGTTLDAMGWGDLYDEIDGGFFRCADTRDWRRPRTEKMLDVNAALLRVYLAAAEVEGVARYRERAQDVLRYVQTWLADPVDGGWSGSQQADELYYERRSPDARHTQPPPAIDRVLYTDWNASMVSAALTAANALDDRALGEFALKSMERVLLACYAPGAGVAHCYDGSVGVRGLLVDQMAMAAALLDAYEATGNLPYEMMAEELAHYALRTMWDARAGGFYDRAPAEASDAVGLLRRRQKPFVANCDAARVLHRLAATSGNHEFADAARGALTTVAPQAAGHGALAAHYVLAEREVAHTSLQLPQG